MLELIGLMAVSAVLVVTGHAWRDRKAGRFLLMAGIATVALIIAMIVFAIFWGFHALVND